jgi:RES domain-containing protein
MIVYRLAKLKFTKKLTGDGAKKTGGRWNSKGVSMIYTCQSRALCTAEIAVHMPLGVVPFDYMLVSIEIADKYAVLELKANDLDSDWNSFPYSHSTQQLGDKFISDGKFLILRAPSAVVQGDYNYLLNPNHKNFSKIKIISSESFNFDKRLFIR